MSSNVFNKVAEKAPAVESYDVHIYFLSEQHHAQAQALADAIKASVPGVEGPNQVKPGRGPHLVSNVEINIPPAALSQVLTFLQLNQVDGVSTLVHPHTGDEVRDHTKLVNWVGKPVPLNIDALLPPEQRKNNVTKFSAPKAA
jgi:aromatic ring-cleaving dioxygenase